MTTLRLLTGFGKFACLNGNKIPHVATSFLQERGIRGL